MSSVSEAFTWAWVKAVVANGGSTSQMKGSIEVPRNSGAESMHQYAPTNLGGIYSIIIYLERNVETQKSKKIWVRYPICHELP